MNRIVALPRRPTGERGSGAVHRSNRVLAAASLLLAVATLAALLFGFSLRNIRGYQRLLGEGDAALASGQPLPAIEAYSGAIALRPDAMLAHLKRGAVYLAQGELDPASRDAHRAAELDPSATRALELLGDAHAAAGRHERAAAAYRRFLQLDDRSAPVAYKLGLALYRGGTDGEALVAAQRAAELQPDFAPAHHLLGLAFWHLNRPEEARASLERAVGLAPQLIVAQEDLAALLASRGALRQASASLERLVALEPDRPERLLALADMQVLAGRPAAAVATLEQGLERFPGRPSLQLAAARVAGSQGGRPRAERERIQRAYARVAASSSADSDTLAEAAEGLLQLGDVRGAEQAIAEAVARTPVSPRAFLLEARLAERASDVRAARDSYLRFAWLAGDAGTPADVVHRIASLSAQLGEPHVIAGWLPAAQPVPPTR